MRMIFGLIIMGFAAAFAYEACMNECVALWARSTGDLTITKMAPPFWEWSTVRIGAGSVEARTIRLVASRPRIWLPAMDGFVPKILATSSGIAVGFSGDTVFGGGGVLGNGGSWMLFPNWGAAFLSPSEAATLTKWEPRGRGYLKAKGYGN
jgi:hypothetical protein